MSRWRRTVIALVLAAAGMLASSCAGPTRWQKPGAGVDDWDRDEGTCRARARSQAEKEYRSRAAERDSPDRGFGVTFETQMAGYDFRRRERALFENCMRAKGYVPDTGQGK